MSKTKGVLRKKINGIVKTGNVPSAIHRIKQVIRLRLSLLFNGRKAFLKEIYSIEKDFNSSRENLDYSQSGDVITRLLNLTDKLDKTRSNLALIWLPISFILLTIAGIVITNIVEGEPELFNCGGTKSESCAVLIAPFGGTENDIDQVLFQIFSEKQEDWYSIHNLSTNSVEGDKYYFLENTVYQSCEPKIMIYGQGNEGVDGMDIDLKLFSLDYPIKESLDLEDTQYFTVSSFSEKYLSGAIESEGFISTIESYLLRVCDMSSHTVKASVEYVNKSVSDPNLRLFSFQNFAEFFAGKKDFGNAEIMLTHAIESNKDAFDSYAMRGLMRDESGKNYLGAYSDYSHFLKSAPLNFNVRKRRFRSIEKFVEQENELSGKIRSNVINELTKDLRLIARRDDPSDEEYIRDLSNFLDFLKEQEVVQPPIPLEPEPETISVLKGFIQNYPRLLEAGLKVIVAEDIFQDIEKDGSFEIKTDDPAIFAGQFIELHADGFQSDQWQIQESHFNAANPFILSLKANPTDDEHPAQSITISICPFFKGIESLVNFEDRRRKPEKYNTPEYSFTYETKFHIIIQESGKPIEYTVDKLSDRHWKIVLVSKPLDIQIFWNNELLLGEKGLAIHFVKNTRSNVNIDLTRFSSLSRTQPELVESFSLNWNRRNKAYFNELFHARKLCEVQENDWSIYITDGRQNELFKPLQLKKEHFKLGENKLEIFL